MTKARNIATCRSPAVPMEQKDYDALAAWLVEYGSVEGWDTATRLEALSWIRSLRGEHFNYGLRDKPSTAEDRVVTIDEDGHADGPLANAIREGDGRRRAPGWGAN